MHRPGKWQSGAITDGPSRSPARAMLRAVRFAAQDSGKEPHHGGAPNRRAFVVPGAVSGDADPGIECSLL